MFNTLVVGKMSGDPFVRALTFRKCNFWQCLYVLNFVDLNCGSLCSTWILGNLSIEPMVQNCIFGMWNSRPSLDRFTFNLQQTSLQLLPCSGLVASVEESATAAAAPGGFAAVADAVAPALRRGSHCHWPYRPHQPEACHLHCVYSR